MADRVNGGMSFDEIVESGEREDLYQSLLSDLIDRIENDTTNNTTSTFNDLVEQLINGNSQQQIEAAEALIALLDKWDQEINDLIEADLDAQDQQRVSLANLNMASELDPTNNQFSDSQLFDLIATPVYKELFEEEDVDE